MDINRIDPQLRPIYRLLPPIPFHRPAWLNLLRLLIPLVGLSRPPQGVQLETRPLGQTTIRIYRPHNYTPGAGLVWLHGGGFVVGSAAQDDRLCAQYARHLGLVVVSVEYRLAPEAPFPAALEDCHRAWSWLQETAPEMGIDPARVALGGQSAGGGLAACLAQSLLDRGGIQPAAQLLIYPMLDDRTASKRDLDQVLHPLWNNPNNRAGWAAYLGHEPGQVSEPAYAVAARRLDLFGLPPAWIGVGEIDLFFEEDRAYADRLAAMGVDCILYTVPGAPHGFPVVAPQAQLSLDFSAASCRFLARTLGLDLAQDDFSV